MKSTNRLLRWAELPDDIKEYVKPNLEVLCPKPFDEFDGHGLRYSVKWLNEVGGAIVTLPIEYMSEYVDVITKTAIDEKDPVFLMTNILDTDIDALSPTDFETWNATSIGNLAYVASNACTPDAKEIAERMLVKYSDWYIDNLQTKLVNG